MIGILLISLIIKNYKIIETQGKINKDLFMSDLRIKNFAVLVKNETENEGYLADSPKIGNIRRWGCFRNETPFIFVHIGRSGGGGVRRMFAAAANDYSKPSELEPFIQRWTYYRIHVGGSNSTSITANGQFASSYFRNFLPESACSFNMTFERSVPCDAETPIGQATVCSHSSYSIKSRCPRNQPPESSCHLVYTGHNMIGNELHWLPNGYLKKWWTTAFNTTLSWDEIPTGTQCGTYNRTLWKHDLHPDLETKNCRTNLTFHVDSLAEKTFLPVKRVEDENREVQGPERKVLSWSFVYASLPILRVTIFRETFSWLASKYVWHNLEEKGLSHGNIEEMTMRSDDGFKNFLKIRPGPGWANHFALEFILKLCGEDCFVRYIHGTATLLDIERQATDNLLRSFAVVGLQNETSTFFDMVSVRVAYMKNVTRNAHLRQEGGDHRTEWHQAKETYKDPAFQRLLLNASPEIAALERLYKIALEVNRFQLKELRDCPSDLGGKDSSWVGNKR